MDTFASWDGLLSYLQDHAIVYYKAPLDFAPVPVVVAKKFKNGKLRIKAPHLTFTADRGHLDRFRFRSAANKHLHTCVRFSGSPGTEDDCSCGMA